MLNSGRNEVGLGQIRGATDYCQGGKPVTEPRDNNEKVANWTPPPRPDGQVLQGNYVVLEPLSADRHAADIHRANIANDKIWDYLPYGPYSKTADYVAWAKDAEAAADPFFYAIRDKSTGKWCGVASYLRISPDAGSIEVGHINFAQVLQKTPAATEAMFLMMGWAFDAGYRRYEWKCNAMNAGSRRAAGRLGFSFEGVFRQAMVVKGRNRDTAWFAAIDSEWPALKGAFDQWLAPENFDADGQQISRLSDLTRPVLANEDPALKA